MKVVIKRIQNPINNEQAGAVLTAIPEVSINSRQKANIENRLIQFAFDNLYPGEGLNLYREVHSDTPSIVIIKNIGELPHETIDIEI